MKQYEFLISKQGARHTVYCTSQNPDKAEQAVRAAYGNEFPRITRMQEIYEPHRSYAEIDATA